MARIMPTVWRWYLVAAIAASATTTATTGALAAQFVTVSPNVISTTPTNMALPAVFRGHPQELGADAMRLRLASSRRSIKSRLNPIDFSDRITAPRIISVALDDQRRGIVIVRGGDVSFQSIP